MRNAFTMVELIFVIVIIGILAVIAIPKLSATRDDAKVVTELNNITNCVQDIASSYTSSQQEDNNSANCNLVKCAVINLGSLNDGNVTINLKTSSDGYPRYCNFVKEKALKKDLNGTLSFGGVKVKP